MKILVSSLLPSEAAWKFDTAVKCDTLLEYRKFPYTKCKECDGPLIFKDFSKYVCACFNVFVLSGESCGISAAMQLCRHPRFVRIWGNFSRSSWLEWSYIILCSDRASFTLPAWTFCKAEVISKSGMDFDVKSFPYFGNSSINAFMSQISEKQDEESNGLSISRSTPSRYRLWLRTVYNSRHDTSSTDSWDGTDKPARFFRFS